MRNLKYVELLAPAKNPECGIEAIKHGADAVYIGAPRFGARAAAGNTVDDIAQLVKLAHQYWARVYVTLNTLLSDSELADAEKLISDLYNIGVDALIVQDMAVLRMNLPPIALHASTQTDNRNVGKVTFLKDNGFRRVVLARELSLTKIEEIHKCCSDTELEVFVHGALCVSYSGQCYASQLCFGRSANRGECAQFCRLPFDMYDSDENLIVSGKHLLSLKDMNRSDNIEDLLDAGVTSFKIEGRLKDVSYVKNVTAFYNEKLNSILKDRKEYRRASSGGTGLFFAPKLEKSFNRGFTNYSLYGRSDDVFSFDTPKSIGEYMGKVKQSGPGWLTVAGNNTYHNGDGICYFGNDGRLIGFRVNKVENGRLNLFVDNQDEMSTKELIVEPGTEVYRNFDREFEKTLSKETAIRMVDVKMVFGETPDGYRLEILDQDGVGAEVSSVYKKEKAISPQRDNIVKQLSKLGNTIFRAIEVSVDMDSELFIPSSMLSDIRRKAVEALSEARKRKFSRLPGFSHETVAIYPDRKLGYTGNVMNRQAELFYRERGVVDIAPGFEKETVGDAVVMFCHHCIKYAMGWCEKHKGGASPYKEPYYIVSPYGKRFKLIFDCESCQMLVKASDYF